MKTENSKGMVIGVLVLWGGLFVIGLVMTVIGFLIYTGRMEGSGFTLPFGLLVFVRSVIKIIGLIRQTRRSGDEPGGTLEEADDLPKEKDENGPV